MIAYSLTSAVQIFNSIKITATGRAAEIPRVSKKHQYFLDTLMTYGLARKSGKMGENARFYKALLAFLATPKPLMISSRLDTISSESRKRENRMGFHFVLSLLFIASFAFV